MVTSPNGVTWSFTLFQSLTMTIAARACVRKFRVAVCLDHRLGICWRVRYNAARGDQMFAPKTIFIWALLFLLMLCGVVLVYSRMTERIPRGEWGGTHISMNVGEHSATIEFDCAQGEIPGPLNMDGEGKFELPGTFTPERGGPVRAGENQRAQPAAYSGTVKGNTMTLTLKVAGTDETETFTLEKGKPADLFKCK